VRSGGELLFFSFPLRNNFSCILVQKIGGCGGCNFPIIIGKGVEFATQEIE